LHKKFIGLGDVQNVGHQHQHGLTVDVAIDQWHHSHIRILSSLVWRISSHFVHGRPGSMDYQAVHICEKNLLFMNSSRMSQKDEFVIAYSERLLPNTR